MTGFARSQASQEIISITQAEADRHQDKVHEVLDSGEPVEIVDEGGVVSKRKLQHVTTQQARVKIVTWMIADEAENRTKGLFSRAIRAYPEQFRASLNANSMKASRRWQSREEIKWHHC